MRIDMTIKFGEDAVDSYISTLEHLKDMTIVGEWTNPGFPVDCVIVSVDSYGITICESDETGKPITNATWEVGYDEIRSITVL